MVHISLVGDFDANVPAHRAIPLALKRAGDDLGVDVRFTWRHTALITPLSCALVEQVGAVSVAAGSRLAAAYGATTVFEEYHCRYGLAPRHERLLDGGPLRIVGRGGEGEVRAVEIDGHPFFVATLFQPEREALKEKTPPLVRAFIEAAAEMAVPEAAKPFLPR